MLTKDSRHLLICVVIGLLQGLALFCMEWAWPEEDSALRASYMFMLSFVLIGGWQVQLMVGKLHESWRRLLMLSTTLLMSALAAGLSIQYGQPQWYYLGEPSGTLLLCGVYLLAFLVTPFIQAFNPTSNWKLEYVDSFCRYTLKNTLLMFIAFVMLALFWLLAFLWSGLFKVLGIDFFETLFQSSAFIWMSSTTVFAIGLRIGRQQERVIDSLRTVLQAMSLYLLMFTLFMVGLFLLFMPVHGLNPLWETQQASSILLGLILAISLLLSGLVQDSRQIELKPTKVQLTTGAVFVPILAALAAYALWLRIDEYGFMPNRVLALSLTLVACAYSLGMLWLLRCPPRERLQVHRTIYVVLVILTVTLHMLMQIPQLSPQQISAKSQYLRAIDPNTPADKVDIGALRYMTGNAGREYLAKLHEELGSVEPDDRRAMIERELQLLEETDDYWSWRRAREAEAAPDIPWIGEPLLDKDGTFEQAIGDLRCVDEVCGLFAIDLDNDNSPEVIVITERNPTTLSVLAHDDEHAWRWVGHLQVSGQTLDGATLMESLGSGDVKLAKPRFSGLEIGQIKLEPVITQ